MTNVVNFLKETITDSSTYRPQGVIVSYSFQKEADTTPNIFEMPSEFSFDKPITINDILNNFPVKFEEKAYHFRFLALCSTKDPSLKAWIDITNLNAKAPMINKTITMKILEIPTRASSKIFGKSKEFQGQPQQQAPPAQQPERKTPTHHDQGQNGHHHHHRHHGHQVHHPAHHNHMRHQKSNPTSVTQTTSPSNEMNQNTRRSDVNNDFGGWDLPASGGNDQPFEAGLLEEETVTVTKTTATKAPAGGGDLFTWDAEPVKAAPQKPNGGMTAQPSQARPTQQQAPKGGQDLWAPGSEVDSKNREKFDPTRITDEERKELERRAQMKVDELRKAKEEEEEEQKIRERAAALYEPRVIKWAKKGTQRNNIRVLICNLHEVLWEGHTWAQVSIADMGTDNEIRKLFQKAIRIVHPDKNQSRTIDQRFIADRVFYELNESFNGRY